MQLFLMYFYRVLVSFKLILFDPEAINLLPEMNEPFSLSPKLMYEKYNH